MFSVRYVNHNGTEFLLNESDGWYLQSDDFNMLDWAHSYNTLNGKTVGFYNGSIEKSLPIALVASTEAAGLAKRNALYDVTQVDVEATQPGRLYINDWYVEGYIIASTKSLYQYTGRACVYGLTMLVDNPVWTKETNYRIEPQSTSGSGLNYPHNYPHNYAATSNEYIITNESIHDADLRITIYGAVTAPQFKIDDNTYKLSDEAIVGDGERIVVDTEKRTIKLVGTYGDETNYFSFQSGTLRKGSGSYIFEPITKGDHKITWDGSFRFALTVREHQREIRW